MHLVCLISNIFVDSKTTSCAHYPSRALETICTKGSWKSCSHHFWMHLFAACAQIRQGAFWLDGMLYTWLLLLSFPWACCWPAVLCIWGHPDWPSILWAVGTGPLVLPRSAPRSKTRRCPEGPAACQSPGCAKLDSGKHTYTHTREDWQDI